MAGRARGARVETPHRAKALQNHALAAGVSDFWLRNSFELRYSGFGFSRFIGRGADVVLLHTSTGRVGRVVPAWKRLTAPKHCRTMPFAAGFRTSGFGILSSFGIRVSDFKVHWQGGRRPTSHHTSTGPLGTGIALRVAAAGSCMNDATSGAGRYCCFSSPFSSTNCLRQDE